MKRIIFALLLLVAGPTWADGCDITNSGLNAEAVSKLRIACEQAKIEQNANRNVSGDSITKGLTPEKISAIGSVAQEIAKALGSAAKELGVAVNDFLLTPAGILVVLGIFWKLFLVQTMGLIGVVIVLITARWWLVRILVEGFVPTEKPRFFGLYTVTKQVPTYTSFGKLTDNQLGSLCAVCGAALALLAVLIFGFIK